MVGGAELFLILLGEEAAEVVDGIVGGGHLTQVELPDVGLDFSTGEGLAGDLDNFAIGVDAGVGDGGDDEAHVSPASPETARKLVGEDEGKVAAFGGEEGEGLFRAIPCGTNMGLKPAAKLESVKLSLIEKQTQ